MDGQKISEHTERSKKADKIEHTDRETLETMWGTMRTSYQGRYPEVTDKDMDYRQGEFDDMIDRLAARTVQSREDVKNEIRNWDSVRGGDSDD